MRISTIFLALAFCAVNAAGCGDDAATQDAPPTQFYWDEIDDDPGGWRVAKEGEWVARCQLGDTRVFWSQCTDSPVVAQQWAEKWQDIRFSEEGCTSVIALHCPIPGAARELPPLPSVD